MSFLGKDSPEFDKDTDEEICDFVDEYISCELPDNEADPELHTIVAEVLSHSKSHSKSCKKAIKNAGMYFQKPQLGIHLFQGLYPEMMIVMRWKQNAEMQKINFKRSGIF